VGHDLTCRAYDTQFTDRSITLQTSSQSTAITRHNYVINACQPGNGSIQRLRGPRLEGWATT
jgi:hypothetical protein